jgi:CarboxypepD_reg-like domain
MVSVTASSQTMQGYVTDAGTGKPLSSVSVVNVFTHMGTSTDANGFYSIAANTMDVISFSYIGYVPAQKAKPNSVLIATVNIALERTEYQLEEFRLRPGHLTQYQMDSAERASIYKRALVRKPPSPFNSPVSAIADKFSRKSKMTYQFQRNFYEGETEKFIDSRYTPDIVTNLTGATGDSIGHFMYACPMPYNFARTATELELKMWIRDQYRTWVKTIAKDSIKHEQQATGR